MSENNLPKAQSVTKNFIMNVILKISAYIFPLITFPYVSRVLGATGNGKITFATSVISYFSMFAQLGIPTYGIRVCAACREDKKKFNKTVQELLIINSFLIVVVYVVFSISLFAVPRFQEDRTLLIITSATILLNGVGMNWMFQALEQYSYIAVRNLLFKVISVVLMFLLVHDAKDYVIYGGISVLGSCGSNVINMIYASRFLDHKPIGSYNFKQHIRPILNFFMLSVAVSVYTSMDSVMLGFISGDTEVGYYAAATKMKMILVNTVTALGTVLIPRMSFYIAKGKKDDYNRLLKKSFEFVLIAAIPLAIYFSVMANATISFLAGDGYSEAVLPMQIISITIVLIGLSNITGMQMLVPTKREKYTTTSTIIGAVVNLIVNAIAIPKFASSGAAFGTVMAEASVLLVQVYYLRTEMGDALRGIHIGKIVIPNLIATVCLVILTHYYDITNPFLQLVITAVVFFGIYGVMLLILKEEFVVEMMNKYVISRLHKIKRR